MDILDAQQQPAAPAGPDPFAQMAQAELDLAAAPNPPQPVDPLSAPLSVEGDPNAPWWTGQADKPQVQEGQPVAPAAAAPQPDAKPVDANVAAILADNAALRAQQQEQAHQLNQTMQALAGLVAKSQQPAERHLTPEEMTAKRDAVLAELAKDPQAFIAAEAAKLVEGKSDAIRQQVIQELQNQGQLRGPEERIQSAAQQGIQHLAKTGVWTQQLTPEFQQGLTSAQNIANVLSTFYPEKAQEFSRPGASPDAYAKFLSAEGPVFWERAAVLNARAMAAQPRPGIQPVNQERLRQQAMAPRPSAVQGQLGAPTQADGMFQEAPNLSDAFAAALKGRG